MQNTFSCIVVVCFARMRHTNWVMCWTSVSSCCAWKRFKSLYVYHGKWAWEQNVWYGLWRHTKAVTHLWREIHIFMVCCWVNLKPCGVYACSFFGNEVKLAVKLYFLVVPPRNLNGACQCAVQWRENPSRIMKNTWKKMRGSKNTLYGRSPPWLSETGSIFLSHKHHQDFTGISAKQLSQAFFTGLC